MGEKSVEQVKPGSYIHYVDKGFPNNEFRTYYYIIDKRRKAKVFPGWNGAMGIPVRAYGFTQEHINTFRSRGATHTYIHCKTQVKAVGKKRWRPR